jgi:inosine-uridine nucleoside N-ribohydrolase
MQKILLDTDIGNDIDDALCVTYLLTQPSCDLLGITTVCGAPRERAMMVSAICKHLGKDVPIYPGIAEPLLGVQRQPFPPQFEAMGTWAHEKTFPDRQAISFMQKTIRENPGEVTLLAIGPLTNVAALFAADREIPRLLKELVLMCGRFTNKMPNANPAEWNAYCDPTAAAIVYGSGAPIRSIGLDVTLQLTMSQAQTQKAFTAAAFRPAVDFAGVWFQGSAEIVFHDPLAAVSIFEPSVCGWERGNVGIELKSDILSGYTHFTPDPNGRHEVAVSVNRERFFDLFFQ